MLASCVLETECRPVGVNGWTAVAAAAGTVRRAGSVAGTDHLQRRILARVVDRPASRGDCSLLQDMREALVPVDYAEVDALQKFWHDNEFPDLTAVAHCFAIFRARL